LFLNFIQELLNNKILWISILSWFVAQLLKLLINYYRVGVFDLNFLMSSGGMPSSHSSIVTSMATSIGFSQGFDSYAFATATVLSLIVMYDATGVRRAAGKQAEVLNKLILNLGDSSIPIDTKLKELLGHTPLQVFAGAVLGIFIAILSKNLI
jgi:uncharacterized protein